jgi:hypothetical protein
MSKTFIYEKVYGSSYDERRDKTEYYGSEIEYEVDNKDLLDAVIELIIEDYFNGKDVRQALKYLIKDIDLLDILVEYYEDSLKEVFEQEALDSYD